MKNMEYLTRVLPLSHYVLLICVLLSYAVCSSATGDDKVCGGVLNCVRCERVNRTNNCTKCSQLVVVKGKHCDASAKCPPGYTPHWKSLVDYIATSCTGEGDGFWSDEVVGSLVGAGLCVAGAAGALVYLSRNRRRHPPPTLHHHSAGSSTTDEGDLVEYAKQVASLRPHANTFLDMINDTRRQVRHLQSPSALQPYKPVLKDLSRILILINRRECKLGTPPPDWETLLAWAHRVLARYNKNHQHPAQVNDLVRFLGGGEPQSMTQFAVSVFDSNYNTRKGEQQDDWTAQELNDFFTLGFRPQDEITTEL